MNAYDIVNALKDHKGAHIKVAWQRNCKVRKGSPPVAKRTVAHVRTGIDYQNLGKVTQGIANGERGEVQAIWNGKGQWKEFPFILSHVETGQEYVRMYPAVFDNLRAKSEFLLAGKSVTLDEVKPYLLASELPKDETPDCFTVKADDVVTIG